MNELQIFEINTDNDTLTLLARDLYNFLEIDSNYTTWFNRMTEYGFEEDKDFIPFLEESTGGRPKANHQITIDMAKEISMIQRNEKGKLARQYFIEIEKEWNSPEKIMARALKLANTQIENLNQKLLKQKPKVDFYNAVAGSKTAIEMDKVAKVLGIRGYGRNNLFKFLRDEKILQQNNIPYQTYVDRGYFRVVEQRFNKPNGEVCINLKTLVYQKGINFIRKLIQNG